MHERLKKVKLIVVDIYPHLKVPLGPSKTLHPSVNSGKRLSFLY